uniref:Cas12f1-like TNB domain-containing protein n=1 Tax=viral metagenome TaxID=1070528 RepID=A0A6C0AG02_9ZZZZ
MIRIFKNGNYKTYLINEFRTSKICNCCGGNLEKFLERKSHKPNLYREGKEEVVHGLLRCQSITRECKIIHNRDKNAVQNMLNIVNSVFKTGRRPDVFCRSVLKNSYQLHD